MSDHGGFSFFHRSFFDWITSPQREGQPSCVRISEAEDMLAATGYSLFSRVRHLAQGDGKDHAGSLSAVIQAHPEWSYFTRQLHHHLYAAGKILETLDVLSEHGWTGAAQGLPPLHEVCRYGFHNCIDVLVKRDPSCLLYQEDVCADQ